MSLDHWEKSILTYLSVSSARRALLDVRAAYQTAQSLLQCPFHFHYWEGVLAAYTYNDKTLALYQ